MSDDLDAAAFPGSVYDAARAAVYEGSVRVTFTSTPSPDRIERTSVRLSTPAAARELAEYLIRAADEAEHTTKEVAP